MTELSFLIELLLKHDLPIATKELIAERIKEVEANLHANFQAKPAYAPIPSLQSPPAYAVPKMPAMPQVPVEQVGQTPEAIAAMQSRSQAIAEAISGKIPKGQERPRKF